MLLQSPIPAPGGDAGSPAQVSGFQWDLGSALLLTLFKSISQPVLYVVLYVYLYNTLLTFYIHSQPVLCVCFILTLFNISPPVVCCCMSICIITTLFISLFSFYLFFIS